MKIFSTLKSLLILGMATIPLNANAQSHDFSRQHHFPEPEARFTLTLPFGHTRQSAKYEPRLELGIRNYGNAQLQPGAWLLKSNAEYTDSLVGVTLNSNPNVMLNGQIIEFDSEHANASSAKKVGTGVLVAGVLIVGGALLILALNPADDSGDGV